MAAEMGLIFPVVLQIPVNLLFLVVAVAVVGVEAPHRQVVIPYTAVVVAAVGRVRSLVKPVVLQLQVVMDLLGKLRPLHLLRVQHLRVVQVVQKPEVLVPADLVEFGLLIGKGEI